MCCGAQVLVVFPPGHVGDQKSERGCDPHRFCTLSGALSPELYRLGTPPAHPCHTAGRHQGHHGPRIGPGRPGFLKPHFWQKRSFCLPSRGGNLRAKLACLGSARSPGHGGSVERRGSPNGGVVQFLETQTCRVGLCVCVREGEGRAFGSGTGSVGMW